MKAIEAIARSDERSEFNEKLAIQNAASVGMTSRVLRGSAWSLGGQAATLATSLIATPFVIRQLGTEAYGVLALINVLTGYLAFADLGMGTASVRFGAEAFARKRDDDEAAVLWTSLSMSSIPTFVAALSLIIGAGALVEHVLRLPAHMIAPAAVALRLTAIAFVARSIAGVLNAPQLVRMKLSLFTAINTCGAIAQIGLIPIALLWGGGVVTAAGVIVAANLAIACAHAAASSRLLPRMKSPRVNTELFKPLLKFGSATAALTILGLILMNAEKLLVTRFSSVTVLAYYSVAFTLARLLAFLPGAISQPLLPAFSRLHAAGELQAIKLLYARAIRGLIVWLLPAAVLIAVSSKALLTIWAGPDYARESVVPLFVLLLGCVFDGLSYVPRMLLSAIGRPQLIVRYQLITLAPYILVAVLLVLPFGAFGAAAAWSLRAIAEAILMFYGARVEMGASSLPAQQQWRQYLFAAAVLIVPIALVRPNSVVAAVVVAFAFFAYGGCVWRFVLTGEERLLLNRFVRAAAGFAQLRDQ